MDARWRTARINPESAASEFLEQGPEQRLALQYAGRSEGDLARLVRAGNHRAFRELVARYRDRVYAFALDCTGCEDEAADVVCEAFVSAFRAVDREKDEPPRRWFYIHTLRAVLARRERAATTLSSEDEP